MPIDNSKIESLSASAGISLGRSLPIYIIFVDLCNSTEFKSYCLSNNVPDGMWMERQLIYLHRVISRIRRFDGIVAKTIGDEVMGYFLDESPAENVLRCATDCHSLFRDISRYDNEQWRLESKVSLDYGRVYDSNFNLLQQNVVDPIGIAVDRCARLKGECQANEVVFSSSVFSLLRADLQTRFGRYKESKRFKGIGDAEFYRIAIG